MYERLYSMSTNTERALIVLREVTQAQYDKPPHIRRGQAMYNRLTEIAPDVALEINGTELDPFYQDDRIDDFLDAIVFIMKARS